MPTTESFNFLKIENSVQVTTLIEKSQNSLEQDFISLVKARKVIKCMIANKFAGLKEKTKECENLETKEEDDADISDDEEIEDKLQT